jgi:hypothetical protein
MSTPAVKERRRHPRLVACIPISVKHGDELIEGFTENFCYSGVLVQSLGGLPALHDRCVITLYLPIGEVEAEARVVRVHEDTRQFAMELLTIKKNGSALLALVLNPHVGTMV